MTATALVDAMIVKLLRDLVAVRAPPSDGGQKCEEAAAAAPSGS